MQHIEEKLLDKDPFYGIIEVGESESDWQLLGGVLDLPTPRNTFWRHHIEYHQPEVSLVSCTVHGALGCVSDLTGIAFSLAQRKEMWSEAIKRGAREGFGWSLSGAVDLVREMAEKYTGIKFS